MSKPDVNDAGRAAGASVTAGRDAGPVSGRYPTGSPARPRQAPLQEGLALRRRPLHADIRHT